MLGESGVLATGGFARLNSDVLKQPNSRANLPDSITPPGYYEIAATNTGGGPARGHIIGDQLGGPGNVKENFVAMFQNANRKMSDYEGQIAKQLKNGKTVYYDVTPIYRDGTTYPVQMRMEARFADGSGAFADGQGVKVIDNVP